MGQAPVFRDPGLSLDVRVSDLLGRLSVAEKIALLHQHQAPVPRLGMGAFRTGTEALHGVAWLGVATVFPQAVGLGSTWDPELVAQVGAAVGVEVRGLHAKDPHRVGLNVWAPVVNVLRDPRWGRNEEGYAEDPWLTGVLGTAYAQGLRGGDPFYLRTAPTLKHFLAYNNETDRSRTSSNVPPRVLHEYDLPGFRAPLESGAAVAVMCSYNFVNGRPAHLSPLINDELRSWSALDVLVVGDAGAGCNIADSQGYYPDHVAGFAAAVRAGVDCFTEDDSDSGPTVQRITEALRRGLLDESEIDAAVRHILSVRFRLGEFDPPENNPYAGITADVVNSAEHQQLARQAARQAFVLLKNAPPPGQDTALLPLVDRTGPGAPVPTVAVVGPLADTVLPDWYSGTLPYRVTALDALTERLGAGPVTYAEGVDRVILHTPSGPVSGTDDPTGAPLRAGAGDSGPQCHFDVFDWGADTLVFRAVSNGRHVTVDADGILVNDQDGPNGWFVRETLRPVPHGDGTALLHVATDRYVATDPDGLLRATAADLTDATRFTIELVTDGAAQAAAVASCADVTILVLGDHPMVNGRETEDRADLNLPPAQQALLQAVTAANPHTVLVLCSSYPYAIGWAQQNLPAIVWSAHGGQEYGHALTDILYGADEHGTPVDPTGRLPQTWYHHTAELPDLLDYDIIATDATYLYYRGAPLYPFGHGLSYTRFSYTNLRLEKTHVTADDTATIHVDVTNTGTRPGTDIAQLYTRQQRSRVKQPLRQLRAFHRVSLAPGETTTITFQLPASRLAHWDVTTGRPVVEHARHTVAIAASAHDFHLTTTLAVEGHTIAARTLHQLQPTDHDDYHGTRPTNAHPEHTTAVTTTEAHAWTAHHGTDLTHATQLTVLAGATAANSTLTVRLDDPHAGPTIAELQIPVTDHEQPAETTGTLQPTTRTHDLYLCFNNPGITVHQLTFTATAPAAPSGEPQ